jgi:hypothetical protein
MSCGLLLVACACSAENADQLPAGSGEVWDARSSELAELGVAVSLAQYGSQVEVTATNRSERAVCIGSTSWPGKRQGLDHFQILEEGVTVPYAGALNVVLADETLRLEPGEGWTIRTDLKALYRADWRKARVVSFWAPFHECGST